MTQEITKEQAQAALEVLKAFGRQRFEPEFRAEAEDAACIAGAVAKLTDYDGVLCIEVAAVLCEEINYHADAYFLREGDTAYRAKYPEPQDGPADDDEAEGTVMVPAEEVTR